MSFVDDAMKQCVNSAALSATALSLESPCSQLLSCVQHYSSSLSPVSFQFSPQPLLHINHPRALKILSIQSTHPVCSTSILYIYIIHQYTAPIPLLYSPLPSRYLTCFLLKLHYLLFQKHLAPYFWHPSFIPHFFPTRAEYRLNSPYLLSCIQAHDLTIHSYPYLPFQHLPLLFIKTLPNLHHIPFAGCLHIPFLHTSFMNVKSHPP